MAVSTKNFKLFARKIRFHFPFVGKEFNKNADWSAPYKIEKRVEALLHNQMKSHQRILDPVASYIKPF